VVRGVTNYREQAHTSLSALPGSTKFRFWNIGEMIFGITILYSVHRTLRVRHARNRMCIRSMVSVARGDCNHGRNQRGRKVVQKSANRKFACAQPRPMPTYSKPMARRRVESSRFLVSTISGRLVRCLMRSKSNPRNSGQPVPTTSASTPSAAP
jgi:hypothetical protein